MVRVGKNYIDAGALPLYLTKGLEHGLAVSSETAAHRSNTLLLLIMQRHSTVFPAAALWRVFVALLFTRHKPQCPAETWDP